MSEEDSRVNKKNQINSSGKQTEKIMLRNFTNNSQKNRFLEK